MVKEEEEYLERVGAAERKKTWQKDKAAQRKKRQKRYKKDPLLKSIDVAKVRAAKERAALAKERAKFRAAKELAKVRAAKDRARVRAAQGKVNIARGIVKGLTRARKAVV